MVIRQPINIVIQRIDAGGSANAALAHGTAQALLPTPGAADKLIAATQHGTKRRTQPLGEIQPDAVIGGDHILGRDAGGDTGIHQPRAIHMRAPAFPMRHGGHGIELFQRPYRTTTDIGGLFHLQKPLRRGVAGFGPDRAAEFIRGEHALRPAHRHDLHTGQRRMGAAFAMQDMAGFMRHHLITLLAMRQDRDHIAHGAGWQIHRRFLAHQRGHAVA